MKNLLFLLFLAVSFLSCDKKSETFSPRTLTATLIHQGLFGNRSYNPTRHGEAITTQTDWDNFRTTYWSGSWYLPWSSNVDFNTEMLLIGFDAPIPTTNGTMKVEFGNIIENLNDITAPIIYSGEPGLGQSPSRVCCIVKIPKSTKPVVFQL